jgi:hypothetical protein
MNPTTGIALARIAIGVTALAAPDLATRLFRLDGAANKQLPYMNRMFGSRELALGAITLAAPKGARNRLVALGMGVDAADAWTGWSAREAGLVDGRTGTYLTVPAVLAVAAGAVGLLESRRTEENADARA